MEEQRAKADHNNLVVAIALGSTIYNGILAIINGNIASLAFAHVALTEISLLFAALLFVLRKGFYRADLSVILYIGFTLAMTVYVSICTRTVYVDFFRNILIIFCFTLMGSWASKDTVRLAFKIACSLVLIVLLMEIFVISIYEDLFYPARYFVNTRGLVQHEFGGSKLFQNSLKIPGRFSFGIIDHRASSLFLEQVSLANFSGVLLIFIISFWENLSKVERALFIFTVVLILVTNDSRSMLIFSFVCFAGYFLFPRIPRIFAVLYMPLIVLTGLIVQTLKPDADGDTLDGRVVLTMKHMMNMDVPAMLGLSAPEAAQFGDSGYLYVIYAGTIFGLIALWLFVTFYPGGETPSQRRCVHAVSIFMFMNLLIGGTAVFSIKVAGLLWLLVGHLKYQPEGRVAWQDNAAGEGGLPEPQLAAARQ